MQSIEGYSVVERGGIDELEGLVSTMLAQGWVPLGGVAVVTWTTFDDDGYRERSWCYTQAMVKPGVSS